MRLESLKDILSQFPDRDGFWSLTDLAETQQAIHEKILPPENEVYDLRTLELYTQLARVVALQGDFNEAQRILKIVETGLPHHEPAARQHVEIRFLLEQGRLLGLQMIPAKALVLIKQAWELASAQKESFFAIDAAVMLALMSPPKQQLDKLKWALNEAELTPNAESKLWLKNLYVMNAWALFDTRQYDQAMVYFRKALAEPELHGQKLQTLMIKWSIARTERALGLFDDSILQQNEILREFEGRGETNGFVFLEIAECLRQQQKEQEARPYFETAYEILSKNIWFCDNRETELLRIKELYKKRY